MLPPDTLRIENEFDIVPFLPPYGAHLGNKLWILNDRSQSVRFVPLLSSLLFDPSASTNTHRTSGDLEDLSWVDSPVINLLVPEFTMNSAAVHRMGVYRARILQLVGEVEEQQELRDAGQDAGANQEGPLNSNRARD
jgi:hypothetical protein